MCAGADRTGAAPSADAGMPLTPVFMRVHTIYSHSEGACSLGGGPYGRVLRRYALPLWYNIIMHRECMKESVEVSGKANVLIGMYADTLVEHHHAWRAWEALSQCARTAAGRRARDRWERAQFEENSAAFCCQFEAGFAGIKAAQAQAKCLIANGVGAPGQ